MESSGKEIKPKKKFILGKKIIGAGSLILSLLVVAIIFISVPAQALTIGIDTRRKEVNEGNWIYFYSKVDLHRGDLLSEDTLLQVEIVGGGDTYSCLFDIDGKKLTECKDIKVKRIKSYLDDVEYGELNITGIIEGTDESEVHSIGYGFGFTNVEGRGYDEYNERLGRKTELIYKVFFRAPQVNRETEYTIDMKAFISPDGDGITIITDEQNKGTIKVKPRRKRWVEIPIADDDDDDDDDDKCVHSKCKPKKPKKPKDKDNNDNDNDNGKGNDNKVFNSKNKNK